jgi:environmental stress-induced protein Ves
LAHDLSHKKRALLLGMTIFRFDRATLPSTPWRNGGGVTREIARIPLTSALDDFDWRVSIADVSADGPFSNFDEVDRLIVLLGGAGVRLRSSDGKIDHRLDEPLVPFAFSGDDAITAGLIDGASSDFNVMTRRGVARAGVQIVSAARRSIACAAGVLFAARGSWTTHAVRENARARSSTFALEANGGIWWDNEPLSWDLEPRDPDAALIVATVHRSIPRAPAGSG